MAKTTRSTAKSNSGRPRTGAAREAHAATTTTSGAAKAGETTAKSAKATKTVKSKTTMRQGTEIKPARVPQTGKIPTIRAPRSGQAPAGTKSATRRSPGETGADFVVDLPGGTARITIQAKAGVRRVAKDWLRAIEALARTSMSPAEVREQLPEEPAGQQLTPAEVSELEKAGARLASATASAAVRTNTMAWQLGTAVAAYDVADVAERLGVDPTRVRQRLRDRTLYGLRGEGRTWRLPRFQFDEAGHEVPHLGQVLRVLPADLHPRSVEGFLTSPKPELVIDGKPRTPRGWLLSGGPADPVLALAASLAAQ